MAGNSLFLHHLYNFPLGAQEVKTNKIKIIIVKNLKLNRKFVIIVFIKFKNTNFTFNKLILI